MFEELKDKKILILGVGLEGLSTLRLLKKIFPKKTVGVADKEELKNLTKEEQKLISAKKVALHLGKNYLDCLLKYDVVIRNPAVPPTLPQIIKAQKMGVKFTSQTILFFENCPGKIIGITGTKGKSTTTSLIYAVLKNGGLLAKLVGNIGRPALSALLAAGPNQIFVYELSSHQLADLKFSPHVAVLLNIFPEHLDYYKDFAEYVKAKQNITRFQKPSDYFIYNADLPILKKVTSETKAKIVPFSLKTPFALGCFLKNNWLIYRADEKEEKIINAKKVPLKGIFNLQNVMPAIIVGKIFGIPNEKIKEAIEKFKPLPHRLEFCGTYKGISFYDDSISTIPESAIAAIDALGESVQTLLLGGYERNQNFRQLAEKIINTPTIKNLILFPTTGKRIWKSVTGRQINHFFVKSMKVAVKLAYQHTDPGKIVLLSPASPSFGLFRDYRDRGRRFQRYAKSRGNQM